MSEVPESLETLSSTREFFRGGAIAFVGFIISSLSNFAFNVLLAHKLGESDYGIFVLGFSVFQVLMVISPMGLDYGAVRFVAIHDGNNDRKGAAAVLINSLVFAGVMSLCLGGGLFVLSGWLAEGLYKEPSLEPVLMIFSAALLVSTPFIVIGSTLQGLKRLDLKTLLQNFLEPCLRLGLAAVLLLAGLGLKGIIFIYPVTYVFTILLSLLFLWRILGWRVDGLFKRDYYEPLLRFSAPLIIGVVPASLLMRLDRLFLGYYVESEQVGLLNVCNQYAMFILMILQSFNFIFAPFVSSLHSQNRMDELEQMLKMMARWIVVGAAPVTALFILYNQELLMIFGEFYMEGKLLLIILCLGQFLSVMLGAAGVVILMSGHPWIENGNLFFGFIIFVVLSLVLIPRYGALGAVIANIAMLNSINVIRPIEVWTILKMHPFSTAGFLAPIMFSAALAALAWLIRLNLRDIHLAIEIAVPVIFFVSGYSMLALRFGLNKDERQLLLSIISGNKQ